MSPLETDKDTICALATAHGIGAISVIRISGKQAAEITRKLAAFLPRQAESHKVYYGILRAIGSGDPIDEVLLSYFQEGRSFTGETTVEISCHGSEAVVDEILRNLILAGARPARRGEFTYRAFIHGRLDLVQAESVLAMIESSSPRAARLALRQLKGGFSERLREIVDDLTWVAAQLEANIDFASEDIVVAEHGELSSRLTKAVERVEQLLAGYRQGRLLRGGFQVALVGRPNVGKSSLLNALVQEDRAIVTPVAGTTRDFVEASLVRDGVKITFIDTAGLRQTDDPVEKIGIERTWEKIKEVDLVLFVEESGAGLGQDIFPRMPADRTAVVLSKMDLLASLPSRQFTGAQAVLPISVVNGQGMDELLKWLSSRLRMDLAEDSALVSNARQYRGLDTARESIGKARELVALGESPDLIALEVQMGIRALYEILGWTYDDQVMDRVFSEFCLGK